MFLPLIANVARVAVIARATAGLAGHVDIGQEVHFDGDESVAFTLLATAALHVETETPRLIPPCARLGHPGEEIANGREEPGVCGRVRARRAPDGRLVDVDDLVEVIEPLDAVVVAGTLAHGVVQFAHDGRVERFR